MLPCCFILIYSQLIPILIRISQRTTERETKLLSDSEDGDLKPRWPYGVVIYLLLVRRAHQYDRFKSRSSPSGLLFIGQLPTRKNLPNHGFELAYPLGERSFVAPVFGM